VTSWLSESRILREEVHLVGETQGSEVNETLRLSSGDTVYLACRPKVPEVRLVKISCSTF